MSYFSAIIVPRGRAWSSTGVSVEEVSDLAELVQQMRQVDSEVTLAVLEREDEWFALVRVDGDDDPRLFVSDLPAARHSHFAGVFEDSELWSEAGSLAAVGVGSPAGFGEDPAVADEEPPAAGGEELEPPRLAEVPWAGDLALLEDVGLGPAVLEQIVEDDADDPARALTAIGERVGFLDLLEALR